VKLEDQIRECMRLADESRNKVTEHTREAQRELQRSELLGTIVRTLCQQLERERRGQS